MKIGAFAFNLVLVIEQIIELTEGLVKQSLIFETHINTMAHFALTKA